MAEIEGISSGPGGKLAIFGPRANGRKQKQRPRNCLAQYSRKFFPESQTKPTNFDFTNLPIFYLVSSRASI